MKVAKEDAGNYMCQVNTDPMTAQIAHLAVMVPPDIDNTRTSGELGLKSQWGRKVHLVKVKVNFIYPRIL